MNRELALKVVLALVGVVFVMLVYPMVIFMRQEPALSMMLSLYVTLGVFLLLAIRNPPASRSVIAFTAWSSFAHAALMGTQALAQHGRTRRTDRGGCSRGDRRRLDCARANRSKCGVRLAPVGNINRNDGESAGIIPYPNWKGRSLISLTPTHSKIRNEWAPAPGLHDKLRPLFTLGEYEEITCRACCRILIIHQRRDGACFRQEPCRLYANRTCPGNRQAPYARRNNLHLQFTNRSMVARLVFGCYPAGNRAAYRHHGLYRAGDLQAGRSGTRLSCEGRKEQNPPSAIGQQDLRCTNREHSRS